MFRSEKEDRSENIRDVARREFLLRCRRWALYAALLGLLLWGCQRTYGVWRKDHLARQAQDLFQKRDYKGAFLVTQRLLLIDSSNAAGCRVMAEIAKLAGRPESLSWAQRLVTVEPKSENQFLLASTALQFGQLKMAQDAIERTPANVRDTAQWHQLAGGLAVAKGDLAGAENEFARALTLAPNDFQIALNLASVQLKSPDAKIVEKARQDLMRLTGESPVRLQAWRALTAEAVAQKQHPDAEQYGEKLVAQPDATLADHLLYLEACQGSDRARKALEETKHLANSNPAAAADLLTWMNRHDLARDALSWSRELPSSIAQTQPVPLAIAEWYSCTRDWTGLRGFVAGKNWNDFESLRLAIASHAARRLNELDINSMESETLWRSAVKAAQSHADQLSAIARLAQGWGYENEAEDAWWTQANGNDNPKDALIALNRHYREKRDTFGLLRVAKRAYELNPDDLIAANNAASLGLLLKNDSAARRLAEKLHDEHPRNAIFAVTYAFALYTEGKTRDGINVMSKLKPDQLRVPAIAAYYVVLLVENGEFDRARQFLSAAKQAPLLPEEERLLNAATKKLI